MSCLLFERKKLDFGVICWLFFSSSKTMTFTSGLNMPCCSRTVVHGHLTPSIKHLAIWMSVIVINQKIKALWWSYVYSCLLMVHGICLFTFCGLLYEVMSIVAFWWFTEYVCSPSVGSCMKLCLVAFWWFTEYVCSPSVGSCMKLLTMVKSFMFYYHKVTCRRNLDVAVNFW